MSRTQSKSLSITVLVLVMAAIVFIHGHADLVASNGEIERYRTIENLIYASALYALRLAVPFMPGVELGLLMVVFGKAGIIAAYISTIVGLNLAFAVGRFFGTRLYGERLQHHTVTRWRNDDWLETAIDRIPVARGLLRICGNGLQNLRYFVVGILFNLPGNSILGGGGGIALVSGLCGTFSWLKFVITVTVATVFVSLLVYLGVVNLESLLNEIL